MSLTNWVLDGDTAQAALEAQGYTVGRRKKIHGVWWVLMTFKPVEGV